MKKFSVIIPNWNGVRFLKVCLESLSKQSYRDFEVIIVDNGSTDESISYIKKEFPRFKVIALEGNFGFARAVNVGIKKAGGDFIALLNNDTETDKNWLKYILKATQNHPKAAFFASKMLDYKRRDIIDSCGDAMTWCGRSYNIGEGNNDSTNYREEKYIFGACAGAAAYRKEFFDRIGHFDEDFFAYLEDIDLDFRAQLMGMKCLFVPDAIVYHIGSATAGRGSGFAFQQMVRNHLLLILKNYPLKSLIRHSVKILYSELRLLAAAKRENYLREYGNAIKGALACLRTVLAKRSIIQRNIVISHEELDEVIDASFPYKAPYQAVKDALGTLGRRS